MRKKKVLPYFSLSLTLLQYFGIEWLNVIGIDWLNVLLRYYIGHAAAEHRPAVQTSVCSVSPEGRAGPAPGCHSVQVRDSVLSL